MSGPYPWIAVHLAIAAGALFPLGCGSHDDADASAPDASVPPTLSALTFEPRGTIAVEPGHVQTLRVVATPPGTYELDFALTGTPLNASLDRSSAVTDSDGVAEVTVTAATDSTTFGVRASLGSVVGQVALSVSAKGFATVDVKPAYAGRRFISYWMATAHTGTTCSELVGTPPPDGTLTVQTSSTGTPRLTDVPVGARLVVTLRAGHYIGGCAEVQGLMRNTVHDVTVPVVDRPIRLDQTELELSLSTEPDSKAMGDALRQHVEDAANALLGESESDVDALLDAMNEATTNATSEQAFAAAREAGNWDDLVRAQLGAGADTAVRDVIEAWMRAGTETLAGPDLFTAGLASAEASEGYVELTLLTVAGLEAEAAGFIVPKPMSWTADPADKVVLAGTIDWKPAKLLAELTRAPALADVPEAATVDEALAAEIGCGSLAETLVAASATAPDSYSGCDLACTEWLCESALELLWRRVAAGPGADARFALTATGTASVDDEARPDGLFKGATWVGTLTTSNVGISLAGAAEASAPESADE